MSDRTVDATQARLERSLDRLTVTYREALRDLVRFPSLLGDEAPAQRFVADLASSAGLEVELWEVDPAELAADPDYAPVDGGEAPRPNVRGVLAGSSGGRSLALSGHVDVVPVAPARLWHHDPFGGEIVDDRLYGRGALDMKGGLIAALHALHAVADTVGHLGGDVVFESVIEEECSGNGMLAARRRGPDVDAAVIPEVSGEQIQIANPGVVWFEVTVIGKPAYVGLAGHSFNAIDLAMEVVSGLRSLPDEFNEIFEHPAYAHADHPLTLNVGTIRGGDWPSNVPLECVVGCRLSFPLGWPVERAQRRVNDRLREIAADHPWLAEHPPTVRWHGFRARGYAIERDAPIVRTLADAARATSPAPPSFGPMFGTADARYFADRGIPAVYYGPAGGGMHSPDEWVSLESVRRVAGALSRTMMEWCR